MNVMTVGPFLLTFKKAEVLFKHCVRPIGYFPIVISALFVFNY